MITAQMANLRHGSNQFRREEFPDGNSSDPPVTRDDVKQLLDVSNGALGRAKNIIRDGVPELVELATSGAVPLSTGVDKWPLRTRVCRARWRVPSAI